MIRNLPSVRAVQRHMQNKENNVDKENAVGATKTPGAKGLSFKTPGRAGLTSKKTVLLNVDKENATPAKVGKGSSGFAKTPGGRVGIQPTALQGKSVNVKETNATVESRSALKNIPKNKHVQLMVPVKTPAPVKRLLQEKVNTPRNTAPTSHEKPLKAAKFETPYKAFDSQRALERSTMSRSGEQVRSLKSSAKKSSTKVKKHFGDENRVESTADVASGTAVEALEDVEIEYMPPSTFEEKYRPDPELIVDHHFLAKPRLDPYVDPAIWDALYDDNLPELSPPDLSMKLPFQDEFFLQQAEDISALEFDDDFMALPFPEVTLEV